MLVCVICVYVWLTLDNGSKEDHIGWSYGRVLANVFWGRERRAEQIRAVSSRARDARKSFGKASGLAL